MWCLVGCNYFIIYYIAHVKIIKHLLNEGPDALAVCRAHRGLPVGFLLLQYSVLLTVESLSLLYLLVIF